MGDDEEDADDEPDFGGNFMDFMSNAVRNIRVDQGLKKQEGKMDRNEPDTVEILLRRAENGFVVEVDYPRRMVPNPQAEGVQSIFSSLSKMASQPVEGHDHGAFMKTIGDTIAKAAKPTKPIRKPHEEYVFQSMETMISFIKETLESAEAADNAPPTK